MRVGIVIPTCDRPAVVLERAVMSALSQTTPAKVVVVNDGLQNILLSQELAGQVLLAKTNGMEGPSAARNRGVSVLADSVDAISYLDDDDELLPNHVEDLLAALGSADYAFGRAIFKYKDFETEDPEPNNKGPKRYYDPSALLRQNIAPVSSFIHTVKAFHEIGGWDESLLRLEDWDFWGRMFIRFGPPNETKKATTVIHKDGENRSDCNRFTYSMSCSWRDIVSDRLKYLSACKRSTIQEGDLQKFHVPRIGVVLPAWNAEKYLSEALDSLRRQTYPDWEALVVDDGSLDGTRVIIDAHRAKDARIRPFPLALNAGVSKALNYGLLVSRSEFVARMDADDVCEPERFAEQVAFLDAHKDIGLCGTWFWSMNEELTKVNWENRTPATPKEVKENLVKTCCIGHPTIMARRRVIECIGGYSELTEHETVEDYEMWRRMIKKFDIANIPRFLLKYREHPAQISQRKIELQHINSIHLYGSE